MVGFAAYTQLDNLVGGMHGEKQESASIGDLTGGVLTWSTPSAITDATDAWREWDGAQTGEGASRIRKSPQLVIGAAMIIDCLLILLPYLILLLCFSTRLKDKIVGTQIQAARDKAQSEALLRALKLLSWCVVVGAAADFIENMLVLVVVNSDAPSEVVKWALVVAGRSKMWLLLIAVIGLLSIAVLRRIRVRATVGV